MLFRSPERLHLFHPLLVSAGAVPLNMMFNMFIADVADYNEWKGLKRMEGTMGSLTGLAGKIGSAFGGFLMGVLMRDRRPWIIYCLK